MRLIATFLKSKNIFIHSWTGKLLRTHCNHKATLHTNHKCCLRRCLGFLIRIHRGAEIAEAFFGDGATGSWEIPSVKTSSHAAGLLLVFF